MRKNALISYCLIFAISASLLLIVFGLIAFVSFWFSVSSSCVFVKAHMFILKSKVHHSIQYAIFVQLFNFFCFCTFRPFFCMWVSAQAMQRFYELLALAFPAILLDLWHAHVWKVLKWNQDYSQNKRICFVSADCLPTALNSESENDFVYQLKYVWDIICKQKQIYSTCIEIHTYTICIRHT